MKVTFSYSYKDLIYYVPPLTHDQAWRLMREAAGCV